MPARLAVLAGIGVHRDEEIGLGLVGDFGAPLQRDEGVVIAREHHLGARQFLLDDFPQAQRHVQAQIFFHQAGWSDRSGVMPAMSGIDHDSSDLQSQRASQRMLAVQRQVGDRRRPHLRGLIVR